jgi:hypothetical protein
MTISLSSIQGSEPLSKNCWVRFAVQDANINPQEDGEAEGKPLHVVYRIQGFVIGGE